MSLNANRFKSLYEGLTTTARKVYESVPALEQWTIDQIIREMVRKNERADKRTVQGTLNSLKESGLVVERGALWQRVAIHQKPKSDGRHHDYAETTTDLDDATKLIGAAVRADYQEMEKLRQLATLLKEI